MAILPIHHQRNGFAGPDTLRSTVDHGWWDPSSQLSEPEPPERQQFEPQFDVLETDDAIIVRGDIPGVHELDLNVTVGDQRLIVSGKRDPSADEAFGTYSNAERPFGTFCRSFALPEDIDAYETMAELEEGVLHIVIPKLPGAPPPPAPRKPS